MRQAMIELLERDHPDQARRVREADLWVRVRPEEAAAGTGLVPHPVSYAVAEPKGRQLVANVLRTG